MAIVKPQVAVADKVLQLTIERLDTLSRKKASNRIYAEEVKRIDAEIKEILDGEKTADVEKVDVE